MKKIISFVLTVMMLANVMVFRTITSAADEIYATSLVNIVTGGDMEGRNSNIEERKVNSDYPDAVYTTDPDNSENTVISFTGAVGGNQPLATVLDVTSTADNVVYYQPVLNHTYLLSAKVRGTLGTAWFFTKTWPYNNDGNGSTTVTGITNTAWKNIAVTHTVSNNTVTQLMFGYNDKNGNGFMLDDVAIYDITNAYEITAPEVVEIDPLSYANINGKKMSNAGDGVRITVPAGYTLSMNDEVLVAEEDGSYLFEMPEEEAVIVAEAPIYATSLVNMVTGGDMEGKKANIASWNVANTHYPAAVYTADPDNSKNTVISVEGVSGKGEPLVAVLDATSTADNVVYYQPIQNHTYYLSAKVRGTLGTAWFFNRHWPYNNDGNGSTAVTGITNTAWKNITATHTVPNDNPFKLIFGYNDTTGNSFMLDDVAIYDITNAYEITAPDLVTVDPVSYTVIDGKKMSNAGDGVRITAPADYTISMNDEVLAAEEDGSYLFEMPEEDAIIVVEAPIYATSLVNIVTGGDMESKDSNIVSWKVGDTYYPQAVYTVDPDNNQNTVISFTGVSTQGKNGQPLAAVLDATSTADDVVYYQPTLNHTYLLSAKVRGTLGIAWFFSKTWPYNNDGNGSTAVTGITNTGWRDIAVTHTISNAEAKKLMFGYSDQSGNGYMLDDVAIYDVTNAYNVVASDDITIDPLSCVLINNVYKTNAGDTVKFTAPQGATVKIDGEVITPDADGSYTFLMPNANVSISTAEASLVNLIEGGNFEDGTVGKFYANYADVFGHTVTVEDGALKFTASGDLPYGTARTNYLYEMFPGEKYYFTYKGKLGETNATEIFVKAGSNNMFQGEYDANPANAEKFTQFATEYVCSEYSSNINFFLQAIDGVYPVGTYYLDDIELYNITNAVTVNFNVLGDAVITYTDITENGAKLVIDPVNNKVYAEPGAVIQFTVDAPDDDKIVKVEGAEWTGNGYTYTYEVGTQDATITAGHSNSVEIKEVNYDNKNAVISSASALSCIVVAANFDGNNNMNKAVSADVVVSAGGTATIDLSAFDSIEGVKLFVWNNLTDIEPIIGAYTIPAQQ